MKLLFVFWVSVPGAGAAMFESVFQRFGPVTGSGGQSSRIQCAASCAPDKTCHGFISRGDGSCEFRTDSIPLNNTDHYQQTELRNVS